ncbi:MAG: DUF3857 domain-containing protein [bacterium]
MKVNNADFKKKLDNLYSIGFVLSIILCCILLFNSYNAFALSASNNFKIINAKKVKRNIINNKIISKKESVGKTASIKKPIIKGNKNLSAEILNRTIKIRINKKYQLTENVSTNIKILSERSINKYSEVVIPYSLKYQRLKLINAYTLLNGMFKIKPGKHAINIVSPNFAVNYPIYSDIKYFTISMPAVETGSILHYSYKITSFKPLIKNSVFDTVNFTRTIPVKHISLIIYYPVNMHLNIYLHNIKKSNCVRTIKIIKNKKYDVLHLSFSNLSALKKENYMPSLENYRKYISVSSFNSWEKLSSRFYYLFKSAEVYNKNMVKYVNKVNKKDNAHISYNKNSYNKNRVYKKLKKISNLYYNFTKSFQYIGIGYGINGYKPAKAFKTFSDGYGDSKSLAVLFIALLKIEHIKAYPVIATSLNTSDLNKHIINPMQFDSVIIAVIIANKTFYLFPDSSSVKAFKLPSSLAGRKALEILGRNKYKLVMLPEENFKQNKKVYIFKGKINKNGGIRGKISYIYKGVYAKFERSDLKNMNSYKKLMKAGDFLYSFIPGANIKYFKYLHIKNVKKNVILKLKFSDKNYMQGSGNKFIFHLPLPVDNSMMHLVLRNKRIYPLLIGYPFEHKAKIIINLPEKFKLFYMPPLLNISNAAGKIFSKCADIHNNSNNKLVCTSEFISKSSRIKQKDYNKFRSLIREYLQYLKNYYIGLSGH